MAEPRAPGAILNGVAIRRLIGADPPLIEGAVDLERQIQPNGIDLTLESIWRLLDAGQIGIGDDERIVAGREELSCDDRGYYNLVGGAFIARLSEVVHLPRDLMALGRSRSSLLRSGVALHTAVWDAGYSGRSELLLVVHNPAGFRIRRGARFLQLVFFRLEEPTVPYAGAYHGENLAPS